MTTRRRPTIGPISLAARWVIAVLATVVMALIGNYAASNDRVHGVLFQAMSRTDARLDTLEREIAVLKTRFEKELSK